MTKEEIIHRLQYARHRIDNVTYAPDVLKAIDIAIEAVGNTDADTISRAKAIAALGTITMYKGMIPFDTAMERIKRMSSAELSTNLAEVGTDCISRQAAIDIISQHTFYNDYDDTDKCSLLDGLRALPSAQPKRIKGRWISADAIFGGEPFYCSECGENTRDTVMGKPRWNFCPNCGADMREVTT